jgi:hypothetical protein
MKNLEILDISDNIIETLPERICKMPALKKLDCSDNYRKVLVNYTQEFLYFEQTMGAISMGVQTSCFWI